MRLSGRVLGCVGSEYALCGRLSRGFAGRGVRGRYGAGRGDRKRWAESQREGGSKGAARGPRGVAAG